MQVFALTRGQSLGYKGEAGENGFIGTASPETSPLSYSVTYDQGLRAFLLWLEAYREPDSTLRYGHTLPLPIDAPGFESYSDSGRINFNGGAPFLHGGQIKVVTLHFRGERPKGSQRNDNRRDSYVWRSGVYLQEV